MTPPTPAMTPSTSSDEASSGCLRAMARHHVPEPPEEPLESRHRILAQRESQPEDGVHQNQEDGQAQDPVRDHRVDDVAGVVPAFDGAS